jgi:hypothetical protein
LKLLNFSQHLKQNKHLQGDKKLILASIYENIYDKLNESILTEAQGT